MIKSDISSSVMIFSGSPPTISGDEGLVDCCVDCWPDSVGTVAGGYFVELWEVDAYSPEAFCVSFEEAVEVPEIYGLSHPVRKSVAAIMKSAVS